MRRGRSQRGNQHKIPCHRGRTGDKQPKQPWSPKTGRTARRIKQGRPQDARSDGLLKILLHPLGLGAFLESSTRIRKDATGVKIATLLAMGARLADRRQLLLG